MKIRNYVLSLTDGGNGTEDVDVRAETDSLAKEQVPGICGKWMTAREWERYGTDPCVDAYMYAICRWRLWRAGRTKVASGQVRIMIHEPDHKACIEAAGGDVTCDHTWQHEEPASDGGIGMVHRSTCSRCGLCRRDTVNQEPDDSPYIVAYSMDSKTKKAANNDR